MTENTENKMLKAREYEALCDAAKNWDGWGLFKPATTSALAARGFFEKAQHPVYGEKLRITDAGRAAMQKYENRFLS